MSIKSDRWIRAMAQQHDMIVPFAENQVREGVISYGVSSYGYDTRVADEFKVFTNVFNVLVDPKNFDPRSFVDIKADYCDIPPNSFALARSVERFRIPRNVLCIVMGKSTYARCFRGDTQVALTDGTTITLEQMARCAEQGERFWGYSVDRTGQIIATLLEHPRYIGRDMLLELVLDNGAAIHCTPDHRFMLRDRRMLSAAELQPGAALMPLYREVVRGQESIYQPCNDGYTAVSRLVDEWAFRSGHSTCISTPNFAVPAQGRVIGGRNHKVVSLREIAGEHDVYCLTVPEAGNFALAAGVFVANCGIIVNVTPLEPEWEGYVTIEVSNTTQLPARIYANEGIAQVMFFESDEVCETSYADKRGKYQAQQGIVLPYIEPPPDQGH